MASSGRAALGIVEVSARYESWLGRLTSLIPRDLALKHDAMRAGSFPFLRATYYRWAERLGSVVPKAAAAPQVLAVGDLHVENFGTWRDAEGRLVWGVNDFDEVWPLPYTNDLIRVATSAVLAAAAGDLRIETREGADALLEGYREGIAHRGRPFVLAEHHTALRDMAVARLHDPEAFWTKLEDFPVVRSVPGVVRAALRRALPDPRLPVTIVHRVAGLGSLGRQRFVAVGTWRGGQVAREAKALAPSACAFASGLLAGRIRARAPYYDTMLRRAVRCPDPHVDVRGSWLVRRLAPDCSRIPLSALPRKRDEARLLWAMGWETANVHLGSAIDAVRADVRRRGRRWLHEAALQMADATEVDWREWRRATA
ncbi:MAG TPA: DUF2252 family protein [Gemmatimonadales bacterium]|nr:DUF2252 family protein [Gemmatimonadales bacterium]